MANSDAWNQGWKIGEGAASEKLGLARPKSFKRGGKVRRTGLAKVHRGEEVLTASEAKSYRRLKSNRKRTITKRAY